MPFRVWLRVFGVLAVVMIAIGALVWVFSSLSVGVVVLLCAGVGLGAFSAGFAVAQQRGERWTDRPREDWRR